MLRGSDPDPLVVAPLTHVRMVLTILIANGEFMQNYIDVANVQMFFIICEKKAFINDLNNIILTNISNRKCFLFSHILSVIIIKSAGNLFFFSFATCFLPLTHEILYCMSGWLY